MPLDHAIHGNEGKVLLGSSVIAELIKWDCKIDQGIASYVAVSGAGWQKVVRGNKKATGTLTGKYSKTVPIDTIINTDSLVGLVLYRSTNRWISMTAMLGEINYSANIDGVPGEIQEWTCAYESDGPVTII